MSKRHSLAQAPLTPFCEPDLSSIHKKAIEHALRWAWQQLINANDPVLHRGTEEAITAAMEQALGQIEQGRRIAPGLKDFDHPVRGAKQITADGRIEKQPDLTFRPPVSAYPAVTNSTAWGYFVECKIIEDNHSSRTVGAYSDQGIRRFAMGEYAARMPTGMMLAFVRGNPLPVAALTALLPLFGAKEIACDAAPDRCSTRHARMQLERPCVDIGLRHLWLSVPGWN